jgi:hypothetical protein
MQTGVLNRLVPWFVVVACMSQADIALGQKASNKAAKPKTASAATAGGDGTSQDGGGDKASQSKKSGDGSDSCQRFHIVGRDELGLTKKENDDSLLTMLLDTSSGDTWRLAATGTWTKIGRDGGERYSNIKCGRFAIVSGKDADGKNPQTILWVPQTGATWFMGADRAWSWQPRPLENAK